MVDAGDFLSYEWGGPNFAEVSAAKSSRELSKMWPRGFMQVYAIDMIY